MDIAELAWTIIPTIIVALAIPIGVASATRQYSLFDKVTTVFVFIGFATPDFWLALLLMILFGVQQMPAGRSAILAYASTHLKGSVRTWMGLSAGLDFETKLFAKPEAPRLLAEELSKAAAN